MLKEFKAFITRGNVIDLGVGIVIGAAFTGVVNGFVTGILNPLVALFGDAPLEGLDFGLGTKIVRGEEEARAIFTYGLVLDALLHFLLVSAALFFLVVRPINKFEARRKASAPPPEPQTRACPECLSDIPMKAARCSHCTANIGAAT